MKTSWLPAKDFVATSISWTSKSLVILLRRVLLCIKVFNSMESTECLFRTVLLSDFSWWFCTDKEDGAVEVTNWFLWVNWRDEKKASSFLSISIKQLQQNRTAEYYIWGHPENCSIGKYSSRCNAEFLGYVVQTLCFRISHDRRYGSWIRK